MNVRKLRPVAAIVVLSALFAGGWYIDAQRSRNQSRLTGFFETQPIEVAARASGRVIDIRVHEGDPVKAGDVLVMLDSADLVSELAERREAAAQARATYLDLASGARPEEIARQEGVVAEMAADLARLRNGSRPEEVAEARAQVDAADAAYQRALNGPRPQEILAARAASAAAFARFAASRRGLTTEEVAEARARRDAAVAALTQAQADLKRYRTLYASEAITRQQLDAAVSAELQAAAHRDEMRQAFRRAAEGTPPEELAAARQDWLNARAQLDLLLAGTRPEDIRAAAANLAQARAAAALVEVGPRIEDIDAAAARLAQARASLDELKNGNRPEQVAAAREAARSAQDAALSLAASVEERVVRAPHSGVVDRIPVVVGDLIPAGQTLVRLDDPSDIWIRLYVPENRVAQVTVGGHAQLAVDGIDKPVDTVVESVATQGEFTPVNLQTPEERGLQVFGVRLRPAVFDPRVKAGMYATLVRFGGP
ncbi:MAG: HlyD family secretion protein [Capsulimonadaceae bacterium]